MSRCAQLIQTYPQAEAVAKGASPDTECVNTCVINDAVFLFVLDLDDVAEVSLLDDLMMQNNKNPMR